jgi:hypothetical protein
MEEKEILYQMLDRYIGNLMSYSPMTRMFADPVSNYVKKFIDPYIDAFFMGTNHLNTDVAGEFIKQEINNKVDNFIKEFKTRASS